MHRNMSQQRDISDRRRPLVDYRAELKSPYCRPTANQYDQDKRMRREIANSNERRRMQSINNGFTILRKKLPNQHGEEKLSKANILQQTSDYINKLEDDVKLLTAQLKQMAYRSGDTQSSRKRKNLDRNDSLITGGLRDDDICSTLIDEKLQMQYRLEEEVEKTKKLMRRVAELEKVAASAKAMLAHNAAAQQQQQQQQQQSQVTDSPKKSALVMSVPPITATKSNPNVVTAGPASAVATVTAATPMSATPTAATVVRQRRRGDSPEPPAKQRAMSCHGLQQLILAADHLENERHQTVRTVARRDGKAATVVPLKGDQAVLATSAKGMQHLQFVQLVSAASQAEVAPTAATTVTSSGASSTSAAGTTTTSSVTASGSTPQIIQILPTSQDLPSTPAHVLHLVTQPTRPRIQTVTTMSDSTDGGPSPASAPPAPAQQQQLLRIVPQVRLQASAAASSGVKGEPGSAGTVLGVPEIGQQFTLYMRRPSGSAAAIQQLSTAAVASSTAAATTVTATGATVTSGATVMSASSTTTAAASGATSSTSPASTPPTSHGAPAVENSS